MQTDTPTLGQLLREARKKAGLTQAEVSDAIGIKQGNISGHESGKTDPAFSMVLRYCRLYRIRVSQLLRPLDHQTTVK